MSEAETIHRAVAGDQQAWSDIYNSHQGRVNALCLRMLGNRSDAEDLTQDVWLQVFRKLAGFQGKARLATWIHRITVNTVLMHLRRRRLPLIPLEEMRLGNPRLIAGEHPALAVEDYHAVKTPERLLLSRAIAELAPGYRRIFLLHFVEGYAHSEIAHMTGRSAGNSKSQLHKSKASLRKHPSLGAVKTRSARACLVVRAAL
jgi:RNA polymerase sigma-70 factor, ECF subfamily